jgi:competence CoiA-like predicted nuclease
MYDPKDMVKEWIYEELERQGKEGTLEEYIKVADELPDLIGYRDIVRIVSRME